MLLGLPGFLFELRPYESQAGRWLLDGRVFAGEKSGPGFLASLAPVLFVTGLGVAQVVVALAVESEMEIAIAAEGMLANDLGSAGLFLVACVWGEVQAWIEQTR
jgi:hypothetical protein